MNCVRDIISDDEKIVELIKKSPQTYNSILGSYKDNGTCQQILRRRISRLVKENRVWKLRVPGTRFGLVLFCTPVHDYKIIVSNNITSVKIFYFYDLQEESNYIQMNEYWELKGPNWSKWQYFDEPYIFKKFMLRDGVFRLWD